MSQPTVSPESHQSVTESHSIILFDGVCNFCNSSVNFLIDRDPNGRFRFGALQSEEGLAVLREHGLPVDYFDSIVMIEEGRVWVASDAVLRATRHMPGLWPVLGVFWIIPRPIRDAVYNWIARNRYRWFGKRESCRIPTPEYRARFL
jgi:predicted DCC family thiol-disulfide oxidoreductase YuxK